MIPHKDIKTIDQYIDLFPSEIQIILFKIKDCIQETAPQSTEAIRYSIPTFRLNGNMVHFAAYKNHIGFYPAPSAINQFSKELKPYKISKGTIQFQLNQPIPYDLIKKIVAFRVAEQTHKK